MKKYDVECCCVARKTKKVCNRTCLSLLYGGRWGNCVLMYSNKYSHNWKNLLIIIIIAHTVLIYTLYSI